MYESKSEARLRRLRELLHPADKAETEESGFTLIELMVVLLIMAILLAIAIPTFLAVTGGAKKTATQSNLTNVVTAATALYSRQQSLPTHTKATTTTTTTTPRGLDTTMKKTQTTITFVATGTTWVAKTVAAKNDVSTKAVNNNVAIFAAVDGNTVCWVAAVNNTSTAVGTVPAGNSFYGVKKAATKTCAAGTFTGIAKTTWKPNFSTFKTLT